MYTADKLKRRCVELKFTVDGNCVTSGNPGELKQVLSNLILNALDAVLQGGQLKADQRSLDDSCSTLCTITFLITLASHS